METETETETIMTEQASLSELNELRALLNDHQNEDEGLILETEICLKRSITNELAEAVAERETLRQQYADRVAGYGYPGQEELDAKIADLEQQFSDHSMTLRFRARTDREYRELIENHPLADENPAANSAFWADLAEACFQGSVHRGKLFTPEQLPLSELFEKCTFGEMTHIRSAVFAMNRSDGSRPFLSRSSSGTPNG